VFHDNNALLGNLTQRLAQQDLFDRDRKTPKPAPSAYCCTTPS
jgi:hypothetical protein